MIRCIAVALLLAAGPAVAGEPMDCFNDEADAEPRYTSTQPEVLRVTDADIAAMLMRIRESERPPVAVAARESGVDL